MKPGSGRVFGEVSLKVKASRPGEEGAVVDVIGRSGKRVSSERYQVAE